VLGGAPAPAPSGTAQPSGADSGSEGASTTTAVPGSLALSEGAGGALVLDVTGVSHVSEQWDEEGPCNKRAAARAT
jgi:hypothetical protein